MKMKIGYEITRSAYTRAVASLQLRQNVADALVNDFTEIINSNTQLA